VASTISGNTNASAFFEASFAKPTPYWAKYTPLRELGRSNARNGYKVAGRGERKRQRDRFPLPPKSREGLVTASVKKANQPVFHSKPRGALAFQNGGPLTNCSTEFHPLENLRATRANPRGPPSIAPSGGAFRRANIS